MSNDITSFTYTGHSDYIFALAFSPDSAYLASASRDTTVRIWRMHPHNVGARFIAPNSNGDESASQEGAIKHAPTSIVNNNIEEHIIYREHTHPLLSVAWSPNSKYIASGDTGGIIHTWEAETRKATLTYHGHTRFVRSIAWSPDGLYIASGGDYGDSTVQVWQAITGKNIFTHHRQYRIFAVTWEPGEQHIASSSFDGSVQIWEPFTGNVTLTYHGHTGPVYTSAWSPDGASIASGGQDATIQVWEAATGKTICIYKGHTGAVKALAWSPDSKCIVSGGDDATVRIWEATTGEHITSYTDYKKWIRALAWSPDGKYIAFACDETAWIVTNTH